jgi:hypothetical protein
VVDEYGDNGDGAKAVDFRAIADHFGGVA